MTQQSRDINDSMLSCMDDRSIADAFGLLVQQITYRVAEMVAEQAANRDVPPNNAMSGRRALMDVQAAAEYLGLSPNSMYRLSSSGRIPTFRHGRRVLFRPKDLDAYVEENLYSAADVRRLARDARRAA